MSLADALNVLKDPESDVAIGALGGGAVLGTAAVMSPLINSYLSSEAAKSVDAETRAATAAAISQFEQNYKLPNLNQTPLTQQQYQLLNTYVPKVAQFIQEKAPQMITEAGSQDAKNAQNKALQAYTDLSESGEDAQSKAQREEGLAQAQGAQNRNTNQLLHAYQNQGLAGSGVALSAALQTGQGADAQRRQLALDVAAQNEQRRTAALGQMSSLAGNIRGQNENVEAANTSAINAFNQRNTMNKQNYESYVANQANDAQRLNNSNAQSLANSNVQLANRTNLANRDRQDMIDTTNRNAANTFATTKLNAALGQNQQNREMEQDNIGRNNAMFNQVYQTGATVAGAALGGPAGAAAGSAVGQSAGGTAGGAAGGASIDTTPQQTVGSSEFSPDLENYFSNSNTGVA